MAKYRLGDKVRVKQDAQSPPPPSHVRGRSAVVVKLPKGGWMATFQEEPPPSVLVYRIKLSDAHPDEQPEHDIGEDWLAPE